MTLCFPTIRQILRLPISNGKVLCSPDSLHVMMILRKRKTYTVVLTGGLCNLFIIFPPSFFFSLHDLIIYGIQVFIFTVQMYNHLILTS
uniref:Uncharacterized protein n=1 Tax=Klebsiella pneumoniae TaxID=573 RepID=A0A6G7SMQ1_KLEPN|nr:hypothetical protein [Klebsiella pneumoniae]QJS00848.1 hypothetical protein [Klebsiella pneumoniae]